MKDSQHRLHEMVANYVVSHEHAEIALGGLLLAAAIVGVGWSHRRRMSTSLATSARVTGLLLGVAILGLQATRNGWLTGVDQSVTSWFVTHRNPSVDHLALAVTNSLGPVTTAGLSTIVAVIVGMRLRSALCGLTVLVTVGGASLLCFLIKLLVGRQRPPIAIQETLETDYSFPSGHVTGTVALFGILAVAISITAGRAVKVLVAIVAVVAVMAVALSRLYLGVHWLTDVSAAVLLGTAVVTVGATGLRQLAEHTGAPVPEPAFALPAGKALV